MEKKIGVPCGFDLPDMSWEEWQKMLLGLAHGAQMIDQVVNMSQSMGGGHDATVKMAELDRDAITQAYVILKAIGKALEDIPGCLERNPVQ